MPEGRATMQHVAALAGVSIKTVSRVVNGEPEVSEDLARRVRDAVDRLGYRHNLAASNLRRGTRTASIGVLVQDLGNEYCGELLRAVESTARRRGVAVISASLDEEPGRERQLVASLVERRIDGLVLMPATDDQGYLMPDLRAGLAAVIVDRSPRGISLDSVSVDNREGAASAVRHLASYGHRRIAYLGDDDRITTAVERQSGYRDVLAQLGVPIDPSIERMGVRSEIESEAAVREMLALPQPPTAFFTGRNEVTRGAVRALRELGASHRVALVGFDDFATADLLDPGVTCVKQAVSTEGALAIEMLLARMDGDVSPPRTHVVPTTLVARGSGEIARQ